MAANTVNGSGNGARSGAQALLLLAAPLNSLILQALAYRPRPQVELQREVGFPAQSTLRAQLKRLVELGAVVKHRRDRFPGVLDYSLTPCGRDLLFTADVLEHWLDKAPGGPLPLGDSRAKAVIKALVEGWSTTMLRALAGGSLSLTELDSLISALSYPSLERRLAAMRLTGLVRACSVSGRSTPYAVTDWAREAIAPLAAGALWERHHLAETAPPIGRLDAETAFLLLVPMLRLPTEVSASCRLAAEIPNRRSPHLAGVTVVMDNGAVVSCVTRLQTDTDASVLGSPAAWIRALLKQDADRLELAGDRELGHAVLEGLVGARSVFRPKKLAPVLDASAPIGDSGAN